jgi:prepilin-type N-terminal cleavage/methylation domain-containing protein
MYRSKEKGFTMLEMLVVLAIAGTLVSIAASAFHSYQERTRLRSAIETMGAHIRQARWDARMQSAKSTIVFDVVSSSYTINGKVAATLPRGIRFGADPSVTGKPGQPYSPPPADGVSFDMGGSKNIARFYPTGAVSPTGSVFLTDGRATMAVTVAITGRPKLWRSLGGGRWESF